MVEGLLLALERLMTLPSRVVSPTNIPPLSSAVPGGGNLLRLARLPAEPAVVNVSHVAAS
jgi:hypothetical protein